MSFKLKKYVKDIPKILGNANIVIIGASIFLATLLLFVALRTQESGIGDDYLVNLSAGMLTVGLTVILVDMLRTHNQKKKYAIPKGKAITRIKAIHTALLLGIFTIIFKRDKEFIREFVQVGGADPANNLATFLISYANRLSDLKPTEILLKYSDDELQILKEQLEKTQNSIESTVRRYDFSFLELDFNTDLADLINTIEYSVETFMLDAMDGNELAAIMNEKVDPRLASRALIGGAVHAYVMKLVAFVDKYEK